MPCGGDVLKSARTVNGGFFRLAGQGRANTGYQQLTCRIALFAGFRQRNLRIGAEGQTVFLTFKTVAEIPQLSAAGGYRQIQTLRVSEFLGFFVGLCSEDFTVVQCHLRVSLFIELKDPQSDP